MGRRKAFTLIELMVVVAIIALLFSMLVPSLVRAKQQARVVGCAANLHAIGVAWVYYFNDNDDSFPPRYQSMQWFYGGNQNCPASAEYNLDLPYRPLNPYVGRALKGEDAAKVFRCPGDRVMLNGKGTPAYEVMRGLSPYQYAGNDYMLNFLVLYHPTYDAKTDSIGATDPPLKVTDIKVADSQFVLTGDSQWLYTSWDAEWDVQFHTQKDKMNVLFLDGHVRYMVVGRGDQYVADDYTMLPWDPWPCAEAYQVQTPQ